MTRKLIVALLLGSTLALVAACGSIATPVYESAQAETTEETPEEDHSEEAAAVEEATEAPTEVPPTPTSVPTEAPTEVPPTATTAPTEVPTEAPTEEAAAEDPIAAAIAAGDPAAGMTVFNNSYQTSSGGWMCASCHSVTENEMRLVGPGLYNLYARAGERADAAGLEDGATYVVHSITMTNEYIVEGEPPYPENLMPMNYAEVLTEQELADVVAYILTLGNPDA